MIMLLREKVMASVHLQRMWRGVLERKKLEQRRKDYEQRVFSLPTRDNVSRVFDVIGTVLGHAYCCGSLSSGSNTLLCVCVRARPDTSGDGEVSLPEFLAFCKKAARFDSCVQLLRLGVTHLPLL